MTDTCERASGVHEFQVLIHPSIENPELLAVDVKYIKWKSAKSGNVSNSSWTCKPEQANKAVPEILTTVYQWLANYLSKKELLNG